MPTPIVFEDVAPVVPVRDLQAAPERYRQLGFEVRAYGHGTGYGYAQRGAVSIHLSEWDEHDPKRTGAVIYLYVSDAMPSERNGPVAESRVVWVRLVTRTTECESSGSWIRTAPCTGWVRSCVKDPTGDGRTCRQRQRTLGIRERPKSWHWDGSI
jgi:hypothetical protein